MEDGACWPCWKRGEDVFYYLTVMNENYEQPNAEPLPNSAFGFAPANVIKGLYEFARHQPETPRGAVHLLGSGAILREVIAAGELLAKDWQVASKVWSATSFSELARDAREAGRLNRLHPEAKPRKSHVASCLAESWPVVAATDYVAAYPQLIGAYLPQPFVALGTDGFGRSDTREALRRFFEVDRHHIVVAALQALAEEGQIPGACVTEAIGRYGINPDVAPSWVR